MPYFAPNKYVIKTDTKGKDYQEFSNLPDMDRMIEVSEDQANQVMRKQSQWIEVQKAPAIYTKEVQDEKEVKETTKEVLIKKLGRPKK